MDRGKVFDLGEVSVAELSPFLMEPSLGGVKVPAAVSVFIQDGMEIGFNNFIDTVRECAAGHVGILIILYVLFLPGVDVVGPLREGILVLFSIKGTLQRLHGRGSMEGSGYHVGYIEAFEDGFHVVNIGHGLVSVAVELRIGGSAVLRSVSHSF